MSEILTEKQRYLNQAQRLLTERSSWEPGWRDIARYIRPRRSRWFLQNRNVGTNQESYIINNTATLALRTLEAGMFTGMTNPAQPWFRLSTPVPSQAEKGDVRSWLHMLEERLRQGIARSNIYKCIPLVDSDIGGFGTSAMLLDDDPEKIFAGYVFPIGSYSLATNEKGEVDTIYREFGMTVKQLVRKFGLKRCSVKVRDLYERGDYQEWIEVIHLIEPNEDFEPGKIGRIGMRFHSCWMEKANTGDASGDPELQFLQRGGYMEFPVMAPRWSVNGEDVYGTGPGHEAIGDAKGLQLKERRLAQLLDKVVTPPMVGPSSMMAGNVNHQPGGMTYVDALGQGQKFVPAYQIDPTAIDRLDGSIRRDEYRIKDAFHARLFLALSEADSPERTAREVSEIHSEKMLQLGPVFGRVTVELLEKLINRAIAMLIRNGDVPPPPDELEGSPPRVNFESIVTEAQKAQTVAKVRRLVTDVGAMSGLDRSVLDKVNLDECADELADAYGVKPELMRTDEQVAELRAARAKQQQAAAQMQSMAQGVQGAKLLSETDTGSDNLLTRVIGGVAGAQGAAH